MEADLVGALAVVVVRIVALHVSDRVVIRRRAIANLSVTVMPSMAISVTVAVGATIAISAAASGTSARMGSPRISTPSGITASAVAVIGVPSRANTWILARGSANADAP